MTPLSRRCLHRLARAWIEVRCCVPRDCAGASPHIVLDGMPADKNCRGGCDGGALCRCVTAYAAGRWRCDCLVAALCTVYTGACSTSGGCPSLCPSPWRISPAAPSIARAKRLPANCHSRAPGRPLSAVGSNRGMYRPPAVARPHVPSICLCPRKLRGRLLPYHQPPSDPAPPAALVATPSGFRKRSPAARYRRAVNNAGRWWERRVAALSPMAPQCALYGHTEAWLAG